jgi:translation initiation factor 1
MPGLEDLGKLLGAEPTPTKKDDRKRGYDGQVIVLKVRVEKRRGKPVTIAWGFQSRPAELQALLATCKKTLGAGGQVTDNALELQGDHAIRLRELLIAEGYKVPGGAK